MTCRRSDVMSKGKKRSGARPGRPQRLRGTKGKRKGARLLYVGFFFLLLRRPPRFTLFPYTTLFRSLSEAVLREPQLLAEIVRAEDFHRVLTRDDYLRRRPAVCGRAGHGPAPLAHFRRRELLRIALRDILGIARLPEVTLELSHLADAILETAYRNVRTEFVARHGEPRLADHQIGGRNAG